MSKLKRFAEFYEQGNPPWEQELPPPEVIEAIAQLPAGRGLDLGCGTGRASRYMAQHGWVVDAVDFVPKAIELAQERLTKNITYHLASVTNLDFLHRPYDFALDVGCGHALDDDELPLYEQQLRRLLREDGLFLLFGRLQDGSEDGPSGFDEVRLLQTLTPNFECVRVEHGTTHVRGHTWPSAWYWWRKRPARSMRVIALRLD